MTFKNQLIIIVVGRMGKEFEDFVSNTVKLAWNRRGKTIPLSVLTDSWIKRLLTLQIVNAVFYCPDHKNWQLERLAKEMKHFAMITFTSVESMLVCCKGVF